MFGPLVIELLLVFLAALGLLHHYGQIRKQHVMVTIATLVSWYFSMIIVFILPLDVSSTFYRECVSHGQIIPNSTAAPINSSSATSIINSSFEKRENVRSIDGTNVTSGFATINVTATAATTSNHTLPPTMTSSETPIIATSSPPQANATPYLISSEATLTEASTKCEKPWSYVPDETLPTMWILVYWTSQILTWLVLPFIQSYACAGDFSIVGKIKRALMENAIYYGSYLLVLGLLLMYIAISPKISLNVVKLKVLVITASNTWGLFLLILLLGYGLVEVPRKLWDKADFQLTVMRTYFQLSKLSTEKQEAHENLEDILEELKRVSKMVRYNHPSRKLVNIIISKCTDEFQQSLVNDGIDDYQDFPASGVTANDGNLPSEKTLVRIHKQLLRAYDTMRRTSVQYKILMRRALHLDSVIKNSLSPDQIWKDELPVVEREENYLVHRFMSLRMKWKWYCKVQPMLRKAGAVVLTGLTAMVIWSECTFFNDSPVLSLFAIFINVAKRNYDYIYIELASCTVIFYLCFCAYHTVFRIKFFNYYYIAGHHQTNESSLLFVGMMLCRLTAPLCLNFLGLIHLDTPLISPNGERIETSYTQIMGHLELITFISEGFNVYFPILVLVLCVATYFELGQRCLTMIGFQRFIDGNIDDLASDFINDGKQLLVREKRRIQRQLNAIDRNEQINQLTSSGSSSKMNQRQWKGRYMQKYQRHEDEESGGETKTDDNSHHPKYNSISVEPRAPADDVDDDVIDWSRGGALSSSSSAAGGVTSRPPRNIFDDV